MIERDHYEVLGLQEDSLPEEIDRRYERLSDLLASESLEDELRPWAEGQLALVEQAYAVLGDPTARRDYDLRRRDVAEARAPGAPLQAPVAPQRPQPALEKEEPAAAWWARGPVPMAFGGLFVGVALVLLVAAGTGNWDRVMGIFDRFSGGDSSQDGVGDSLVDEKRVAELEAVVNQDPFDGAALYELGQIYYDAGDWVNVIYWLGRLLEVEPGHVYALNDVALANLYLGRNQDALSTWESALELAPENPVLHYSLGFYFLTLEEWIQSRDHFLRVVELAPDTDRARSAQDHVDAIEAILAGASPGLEGTAAP